MATFRIIPIAGENGRAARQHARRPSFQGSSVGHWEGDTLVVEVTNFNGKPWLGAAQPPTQPPQTSSDALRIVERWSRPDCAGLRVPAVVEDPKMLTAPWTGPVQRRGMLPYDTIQESLCFPDPDLYARHREFAARQLQESRGGPVPAAVDAGREEQCDEHAWPIEQDGDDARHRRGRRGSGSVDGGARRGRATGTRR